MAVEPVGPVVVITDGSPAGLAAVDLAAQEALIRLSHLVVVPAPGTARRSVDPTLAHVRTRYPQVPVDTTGTRDPSLVVQTTLALPVPAEVPVLVYRPATAPATGPVLVGVSDATGPPAAVEFAFAEAAAYGVALLAVHVWSRLFDTGPSGAHPSLVELDRARADAERVLVDALTVCREKYPHVPVRRALRHGMDAAVALTAASRGARLAVVGVVPGAGAGSIAAVLPRRAGCPVALVPHLREGR